ncbi:hypothetical protein IFM89_022151 [Coptis chinensis]|uniref:DUF4378 domain-containing protein n=1 Tax=Coptis chinensis TaxID=261450 RepID=A0A835LSL7_9MAGN|nr:hypothetical protein IFM89_022151 [Coptis chinensis]
MTAGVLQDHKKMEKHIEKQMGCMAGFFQIFDRHPGKHIYSTKRITTSPVTDSTSQSEKSEEAPASSKVQLQSSPECVKSETLAPTDVPAKVSLSVSNYEFKEGLKSTWKFRETPRLSLDSRAIVDAKGSLHPREIRTNAAILSATRCESDSEDDRQRRSPSVVARLMGLDALPESIREPLKKPELRRSASESRSKDLLQCRFTEGNNSLHQKQTNAGVIAESYRSEGGGVKRNLKPDQVKIVPISQWKSRKNFFDSEDFFPEPKHTSSLYGELEKRLKMRGISEPAEDLETLKHILEALQLKGLLHSRRKTQQISNRNFIKESPIVVMKSSSKSPGRIGNQSPPSKVSMRRNGDTLPPVRRRQDGGAVSPRLYSNPVSPDRSNESNAAKSPCSPARRKAVVISVEQRRSSARISSRKNESDQMSKSPRNNRRSVVEISSKDKFSCYTEDESSSISDCSFSTKSQRSEGKNLLTRCDKLLNSIAEITTTTESQPSPVSVLDSSFYRDEFSPIKRCNNFNDQSVELEEDNWSPVISPVRLKSDDSDLVYVSEILKASDLIYDSDLYSLLERQCYKTNSSYLSKVHRKLIFDTITEILDRKKQLPPWKAVSCINPTTTGKLSFRQIWSEFSRIREPSLAEDLSEVICGVLKKDLADETINGWEDCAIETSEVVLDIERSIFKDLISDTIRDLASYAGKSRGFEPKKLLF